MFAIKVENLTKKFNGFAAVDNVSFNIKNGEIFGLSGALFPINSLPSWVKSLAMINPLTHGIEGIRLACQGHHR